MSALKKSRVSNKSKKNIKNHKRLSLKKQRGGARLGDTVYSLPDNTVLGEITSILQNGSHIRYILGNIRDCDKQCCHRDENGKYHVKSSEADILWATEQRLVLNTYNNPPAYSPPTQPRPPSLLPPPVSAPSYSLRDMHSTTKESIKTTILNILNNKQRTDNEKLLGIKFYLESLN
jgi:hypothetical protein